MKKLTTLILIVLLLPFYSLSQEGIKVATWNLEKLGGNKRGGHGGCGDGFKRRTPESLKKIANLIDELNIDLLAIQEVKVTKNEDGSSSNKDLSAIASNLGDNWKVYVAKKHTKLGNYKTGVGFDQVAFLFNSSKVVMKNVEEIVYPAMRMQDSDIHDRHPLVGKFAIIKDGQEMNDFVLVNLHLASGQPKKENKASAMAMVYCEVMKMFSGERKWKNTNDAISFEDDIVFLGDFNHNPYKPQNSSEGDGIHTLLTNDNKTASPGYINLVKEDMKFTRMNKSFSSLIDHIYVSKGMQSFLQYDRALIYRPEGGENCENYAKWREDYSDHFPVIFKVLIMDNDDF